MTVRSIIGRFAMTFILCAGVGVPLIAKADWGSAVGGLAVGAGLDKLGNDVKTAVDKAAGAGMLLEVQAGGQVYIAIQQAKAAYESDLTLSIDKVQAAEQASLNSVATLASDFENKTYKDLSDITKRAQIVVHDLPFSKNFPQVSRYSPGFVEPASDHVHVSLYGDFYDALRDGYKPIAKIGGKEYEANVVTSNLIAFEVPLSQFNLDQGSVRLNFVSVEIPYQETLFLFFHQKRSSTVSLALAALPKSPGAVGVAMTTTSSGVIRQTKVSPEMAQESSDDDIKCGGEHADLAIHTATPDTGWAVIPDSTRWQVTWSQGGEGNGNDWWLERFCSSATAACACVSTEHHGAGTSGKVHFKLIFDEEKPVTNSTTVTQNVQIGWGEQRVVVVPAGASWNLNFQRFDGKIQQIAGVYQDQYVKVGQIGNNIVIATAPFPNVDEPAYTASVQQAVARTQTH